MVGTQRINHRYKSLENYILVTLILFSLLWRIYIKLNIHALLSTTLDGDQLSDSRSGRSTRLWMDFRGGQGIV